MRRRINVASAGAWRSFRDRAARMGVPRTHGGADHAPSWGARRHAPGSVGEAGEGVELDLLVAADADPLGPLWLGVMSKFDIRAFMLPQHIPRRRLGRCQAPRPRRIRDALPDLGQAPADFPPQRGARMSSRSRAMRAVR